MSCDSLQRETSFVLRWGKKSPIGFATDRSKDSRCSASSSFTAASLVGRTWLETRFMTFSCFSFR